MRTGAELLRLAGAGPFAWEGFMPLGSWGLELHSERGEYVETLGALLRQSLADREPVAPPQARLYLVSAAAGGELFPAPDTADQQAAGGNLARWQRLENGAELLYTGWFLVVVARAATGDPATIAIFIRQPQYSQRAFQDHLFTVLSRLLFRFDRFYLHAGAVDFAGGVSLFVGPAGHGKSTTCLRLAQAGATILSEDHVLLRRDAHDRRCFWVSGCQETARVTPKTEAALFAAKGRRGFTPVDGPGGPKMEFQAGDFFAADPYRDYRFQRVFFNHVGGRFRIQSLSRREAVLRLIYMTRSFFRITGEADLEEYLDFFSDLAAGRAFYDLELSPDLSELERLAAFLQAEGSELGG